MARQRYQVLAAIARSETDHFTVDSLHDLTGVNKATIRSILNRSVEWIRQGAAQRTGKRGGQIVTYFVSAQAKAQLRMNLESIFREVEPGFSDISLAEPSLPEEALERVPVELKAAEALLRDRYPTASEAAKVHILEQVNDYLAAAEDAIAERDEDGIDCTEARSRLWAARVRTALTGMKPFLSSDHSKHRPAVVVGTPVAHSQEFAERVHARLNGFFKDYKIPVSYVPTFDFVHVATGRAADRPGITVIAFDSKIHGPFAQLPVLLRAATAGSFAIVVDTVRDERLEALAAESNAYYVWDVESISDQRFVAQIGTAAISRTGEVQRQMSKLRLVEAE